MLSNSLRLASSAADALGARLTLHIQVGNFEAACRMIEAGVGIAIVALSDAWAERKLKICVCSVKDLPPFARALVDRLMAGI